MSRRPNKKRKKPKPKRKGVHEVPFTVPRDLAKDHMVLSEASATLAESAAVLREMESILNTPIPDPASPQFESLVNRAFKFADRRDEAFDALAHHESQGTIDVGSAERLGAILIEWPTGTKDDWRDSLSTLVGVSLQEAGKLRTPTKNAWDFDPASLSEAVSTELETEHDVKVTSDFPPPFDPDLPPQYDPDVDHLPTGEDEKNLHFQPYELPDRPLWMSTPSLLKMQEAVMEVAPNAGQKLVEHLRRTLAPDGRHTIHEAWLVKPKDGPSHPYIEARMRLAFRGHDPEEGGHATRLAFRQDHFELYLSPAYRVAAAEVITNEQLELPPPSEKPLWTRAASFDKVWTEVDRLARTLQAYEERLHLVADGTVAEIVPEVSDEIDTFMRSGRSALSMECLTQLRQAHVIHIDPPQVEALPQWETVPYIWQYAAEVQLPFPVVYFDFETPAGTHPLVKPAKAPPGVVELDLRGALFWRDHKTSALCCMIMGGVEQGINQHRPRAKVVFGPDYEPEPKLITSQFLDFDSTLQTVPCWQATDPELAAAEREAKKEDSPNLVDATFRFAKSDAADLSACKGHVELTSIPEFRSPAFKGFPLHEAGVELVLASRALACLYLLDAVKVELIDSDPSPDDRRYIKRAEKRGWDQPKVSKTVFIPSPKRRSSRKSEPSGRHIEFTHRFDVIGHYKHFPPETRFAQANPDKVKSCDRGDHPFCARMYCPPFVKGPEDKPYIPKTHAVREQEETPEEDAA